MKKALTVIWRHDFIRETFNEAIKHRRSGIAGDGKWQCTYQLWQQNGNGIRGLFSQVKSCIVTKT
ncbi:MAG: hypothetical protein COW15_18365 [Shewanella sp. CG12_big_fil_rev_8_21_14_0_65_47_15]|nr:MAG: hypothetical protein COW15_18365 [Shewanella sp. CG12_big_fil_rev_8_21_14_0_65_47_15]